MKIYLYCFLLSVFIALFILFLTFVVFNLVHILNLHSMYDNTFLACRGWDWVEIKKNTSVSIKMTVIVKRYIINLKVWKYFLDTRGTTFFNVSFYALCLHLIQTCFYWRFGPICLLTITYKLGHSKISWGCSYEI